MENMDSPDERKENLNAASGNTKRYSILKPINEEINFEETTRFRKNRRVSFANKVDYKTLDESLKNNPNASQEMVVEKTTSTTSALSDMSNFASMSVVTTTTTVSTSSKTQLTVSPPQSDMPVRDTANMEEVEMDMEDDDQSVQYDQSTINQTRFMNQIDMTMLPVRSSEEHISSQSSSSTSSGDSENSNDSVTSGNTATGITNSMVTTNLTQDVSMDPLPSKGGQNLRPSPLCMLNNVTHSIVVEVSRHASHLLGESSTQPLGEITQSVPKRASADATYVLAAEKIMDEPTGLINDNNCNQNNEHHDEDEAMDQPTGTFVISDKNRRLQNDTLSRTTNLNNTTSQGMLEKMPLPSTSFMINKTLDASSRSFMMDNAGGHQYLDTTATATTPKAPHFLQSHSAAAGNISNLSILGRLNMSTHHAAAAAHLLNQSMPASLPPMPTSTQQFTGQDVIGLIKSMARMHATTSPSTTTSNDDFLETLSARLEAVREQSMALMARKREAVKSAKARCEDESASMRTLRQDRDEWLGRIQKRRDELERLRADAIKMGHQAAFEFNHANADRILNELNEYRQKNEYIQKDYDEKLRTYETLKEAAENMSETLKSLKKGQSEKEELKNMFEKMFGETNLGFRLGYYDNDTIVALFMHDLVQVEIKGTNIVKDLRNQQADTFLTYLNYPLDHVIVRSNIDANTNTYSSQYKTINTHPSNLFRGNKIIPVYLKYCVELVLGEIGSGNVMLTNKKIKYIKDLPMFISHVNLASRMAANLARDFETFAFLTQDTPLKCDFEFKNYMVNLLLISMPDVCLYKLKLKVKPGSYYQQAIPFFIEKVDGEMYEPDHQRIRGLIEDQFFENGSIKAYLDRLMKL